MLKYIYISVRWKLCVFVTAGEDETFRWPNDYFQSHFGRFFHWQRVWEIHFVYFLIASRACSLEKQQQQKKKPSCDVHCTYCRLHSMLFYIIYSKSWNIFYGILHVSTLNHARELRTASRTERDKKRECGIETAEWARHLCIAQCSVCSFTLNYIILMLWWTLKFL